MVASLLPRADRFFDERTDDPYWNESVWFSISKPEERLHGLIQYYFRPNMGMLNGGPALWDPSGTLQWNCLYYNWAHLQASPAGAAKFDMTAYNSLSVKVLEPLTAYAIRYNKDGLEIDCVWRAIGPVHELRTGEVSQEKAAKFHIEQPGRMTGTVRLDGREIAIDCFSMRDTSYGPRNYESLATGGYFWGIAATSAFHAIAKGETEQRVATRKMGNKTPNDLSDEAVKRIIDRLNRLRPWFYQAVYANECYDLEIDTVKYSPEEVCTSIEERLKAGPGTAFEHLRARYARHV
jgi:hypothetical protein